ncbi:hypothetical protein GLOTRDRAFT_48993 [Gloeophyllum trabeum ATCC 11539]|uniref:Uncharacterized protein n=1 Tax=Gloeophyllum trabeum (strain ATCC 11539 / FP-39264 / Madison 617) TaxID=670483 RepID=S7RFK1_GLOTA|nr:uncharacterized protein GLOTRDRAFT_48993 [Gloeophyllum trabeum ATCC 11539]EPQ51294.1 hypothetical protein GLOTRDRAFT_48993 [Gloeophyllum trabeum ATCC 11539]
MEGHKKHFLTGMVYHGEYHFNCRFIDKTGTIWYNDGISTGRQCVIEGTLSNTDMTDLTKCKGKDISLVIYARRY